MLIKGDGLRANLLRSGIGSAIAKTGGMGITLSIAVLLARVLGPENYGIYAYVYALVSILAILAQFGLPVLVMRETAKAVAKSDFATLKGLWRWTGASASGSTLMIIVFCGLVGWLFADNFNRVQLITFACGLALLPGIVAGRLLGGMLRGLHQVVAGQLLDIVLRPGFFLVFLLLVFSLGMVDTLTPSRAMVMHALSAILAGIIGFILFRRARPEGLLQEKVMSHSHRTWMTSALPMGLVAGIQLINTQTDILMLGVFVGSQKVGIYRVAVQGAMLVAFGLQAVNMVVAPQFAKMYTNGQMEKLQRLATASARVALLIAFPAALVFILFGGDLLNIVVGEEYVTGAIPLAILSLGQLVNAGMGSVIILLNMTDHERVVARGVAFAAIGNVVANLFLIPTWGMKGAAIATTLTLIIWNVFLAREAIKRLGINSTAFGARRIL